MKSSPSGTAPRNTNAKHPPLARNAQGHPIAMPDGAASWSIKRETRGRPKVIKGPDGHPYRLSLDATEQDIADNFGAGTYRLDAVDGLGNVIDYVTTIDIAADEVDDDRDAEPDDGPPDAGSTDLRYALQALTQMARAQADSLRAVTEAQADWVKGLASARALPRNAMVLAPSSLLASGHDDDSGDDSDDSDDGTPAAPPPGPERTDWVAGIRAAHELGKSLAPALGAVAALMMKRFGADSAKTTASPPTPSNTTSAEAAPAPATPPSRNPMIHLAEINAGLSADERRFLDLILRSRDGEALATVLLSNSVSDAIALVVDAVAQVRASTARGPAQPQRASSTAQSRGDDVHANSDRDAPAPDALAPQAPEPADATSNTVAATPGRTATPEQADVPQAFMARVMAVAALLDAGEQATILALVPQLSPDSVAAPSMARPQAHR